MKSNSKMLFIIIIAIIFIVFLIILFMVGDKSDVLLWLLISTYSAIIIFSLIYLFIVISDNKLISQEKKRDFEKSKELDKTTAEKEKRLTYLNEFNTGLSNYIANIDDEKKKLIYESFLQKLIDKI